MMRKTSVLLLLTLLTLLSACQRPASDSDAVIVFDQAQASGCDAWLTGKLVIDGCKIKLTSPVETGWLDCDEVTLLQAHFDADADFIEFESHQYEFCQSPLKIAAAGCDANAVEDTETGDGVLRIWMETGWLDCAGIDERIVTFKLPISQ